MVAATEAYTETTITILKDKVERLEKTIREYQADADILINALRNEAADREWCDEFTDFIEEVNSKTTHIKLEDAMQEFTVKIKLTLQIEKEIEVEVTERNAKDAEEVIEDRYSLHELLSEGGSLDNWDYSSQDLEWEVKSVD